MSEDRPNTTGVPMVTEDTPESASHGAVTASAETKALTNGKGFLVTRMATILFGARAEKKETNPVGQTFHLFNSEVLNVAQRQVGFYIKSVFFFSLFINLFYLSSSIYMMQVYDLVIPGSRVETLVLITLLLALALLCMAGLEGVRGYILVRLGLRLDSVVSPKIMPPPLATRPRLACRNALRRSGISTPSASSSRGEVFMPRSMRHGCRFIFSFFLS